MTHLIKICGLSTPDAVRLAEQGGATHLGFIFFEKSPRHVSKQLARDLTAERDQAKSVAVTVNAPLAELDEIVSVMKPDLLQLHGSESAEQVQDVQNRYNLPVIKALSIREQGDLEKVAIYQEVADFLLLDAKAPPHSELPGGNGVSFDWELVTGLISKTPIFLSGGIDQSNVKAAMDQVHSAANSIIGLDVSSGVESAPGVKDGGKIQALLDACR